MRDCSKSTLRDSPSANTHIADRHQLKTINIYNYNIIYIYNITSSKSTMNPFVVQEKEGDVNMEEEKDHEDKEEKGGNEDEEKMEEEDGSVRKKTERDQDDEVMGEEEDEETEDTSILEPEPGEEEGGEEVDTQKEDQLLMEDEVGQDLHDGMDSEEYLRNYVNSDLGNNPEYEYQSFPESNIESPKDNMSDDDDSSQILNSQAHANDSYSSEISNKSNYYSTKPNDGSTINSQDESIEHLQTSSITEPPEVEVILEVEEQEEEEGADPEVLCVGEVTVEEKEQETTGEEGGSKGRGDHPMANTDWRPEYREVKIKPM